MIAERMLAYPEVRSRAFIVELRVSIPSWRGRWDTHDGIVQGVVR